MSILNACSKVESSASLCREALESLAVKISNASLIAPTQSNLRSRASHALNSGRHMMTRSI